MFMCLHAKMKNSGFMSCFEYGSLTSRNSKFIEESYIDKSVRKFSNRILTKEQ